MVQAGGDQNTVEETVQEHTERTRRGHDAGQRVDGRRRNRPHIGRDQCQRKDDGDHDDEHELAVAVQRKRALELGIDKAVMHDRHDHAQDHAQEHAHIGHVEAQVDGLAGAVQVAGGAALGHQAGHRQPLGVGRQPDQVADQRYKRGVGFALFGKVHRDAHAEQNAQVAHDGTDAAVDKGADHVQDAALRDDGGVAHDRRKGLDHTGQRQEQDRANQSLGKALHGVHNFGFHWLCSSLLRFIIRFISGSGWRLPDRRLYFINSAQTLQDFLIGFEHVHHDRNMFHFFARCGALFAAPLDLPRAGSYNLKKRLCAGTTLYGRGQP